MSAGKMKLALLAGGRSVEREVSLNSGAQVARALNSDKYDVIHYDPAEDLERLIKDAPGLDVALILLHGRFGEDGTLQGLLDQINLPYQGSGVLSSALCMNKNATKSLYRQNGLPVGRDMILDRQAQCPPDEIIDKLGLPLVVKPVGEGSSVGLTIAWTKEDLNLGLEKAFRLDRSLLLEEYLAGREITAGILGNDVLEALPLIEIIPGDGYTFFDYEAKYKPGASREVCPAPLDEELTRQAQELALAAHRALFCRGYSRTDMILKNGQYFLLETNTIPGMTETSLYPQAARAAGYSFTALMDRLIELALQDRNNK